MNVYLVSSVLLQQVTPQSTIPLLSLLLRSVHITVAGTNLYAVNSGLGGICSQCQSSEGYLLISFQVKCFLSFISPAPFDIFEDSLL